MKKRDLNACPICHNLNIDDEEAFLDDLKCTFRVYAKNDLIIQQGQLCEAFYMLTIGSVRTEMVSENGNIMGIETIEAPKPIAAALLFSDNNRFQFNVIALDDVEIIVIPKSEIMRMMMTNPDFMQNYLAHNANRTQVLTSRLQLLSIKTIKGKLAHYLLEQAKNTDKPFTVSKTQSELAEFFSVARPSLARSLSEMVQDGIISIHRKVYTIIDLNKMKELLV
ncbi:MAG: Crp/Fnr family transcriptional regulator [Bacteroidales bacterium]|nr:MAG: Crp/Fnr family transcriptional regulator [Paludibacter sp.]MCE1155401.1 Crp/Fnr family transcriptional regulator [Bacteroidales bacterium]OJX83826.1 MAG: cAMP-binding protein [Paludibacter sp. 47-17]